MSVSEEFRNAVGTKDVRLIRIMLKDSLVADPTFAEFEQMMSLVRGLEDLFDSHDGEKMKYDSSSWTKQYMDEQMVQIVYNFSRERLDLLKRICRHLYSSGETESEARRKPEFTSKEKLNNKQIGTGIAVAGIAAAAAGIVLSKELIIGVGVVGIVAGGILIITDK